MITEKKILARIQAADDTPPASAYAEEIPSNQYVTGNLLSQSAYSQTKEEDNGNGNLGSYTSVELDKTASANVYLEKIAKYKTLKDWAKGLVRNVREAEPLTQVGMTVGTLIGAGKISNMYDAAVTHRSQSAYEERSLRALQAINRNLNKAVVVKPVKNN